jgi:hypothetical protein
MMVAVLLETHNRTSDCELPEYALVQSGTRRRGDEKMA